MTKALNFTHFAMCLFLKGAFRIYPIPDEATELPETMFTNLPSSEPIECTVRVYVILVRHTCDMH